MSSNEYDVAESGAIIGALIRNGVLPADGPPVTEQHHAILRDIGAAFVDDVIVFQGATQWADNEVIEPPIDNKYIVMKRDALDVWMGQFRDMARQVLQGRFVDTSSLPPVTDLGLPDAVVIRRQDLFSPPALDAYANSILIAVEALKADSAGYSSNLVLRLQALARYFHAQAVAAWDTDRKMPD